MQTAKDSQPVPEFGSGLRAHLERGSGPCAEAQAVAEPVGPPVAPAQPTSHPLDDAARSFLAHRAEEHAEALWAVFADALAATTANGRPDHRTRLLAASTLMAEAFGPRPRSGGKRPRVKDELAELRRRRTARAG
jgi:hypothetical protein